MKYTVKVSPSRSISIQGGSNSIVYEDTLLRDTKSDVFNRLAEKAKYFSGDDTFDVNGKTNIAWDTAFAEIKKIF